MIFEFHKFLLEYKKDWCSDYLNVVNRLYCDKTGDVEVLGAKKKNNTQRVMSNVCLHVNQRNINVAR